MMVNETGVIQSLADLIGASDPALRLLLSLIVGYPMLIFHRYTLHRRSALMQHFYFITCGLSIAYFNYGFNALHSVVCLFTAWILLCLIGGTLLSVIISFIFQMGYLLVGYYYTTGDIYIIKWTMPHCVLTLRLIALTFDLYDGRKMPNELSSNQKETVLRKTPTLIEVAAQTYFPASFMVGPQFPMKRYLDFVHGTLYPYSSPPSLLCGLRRGCLGMLYLCIYQFGTHFIPEYFIVHEDFLNLTFWKRLIIVGLWGKIILYKYLSCWLISEGACMVSGLPFSGINASGIPMWKACANIKLEVFEKATKFEHLISSFNVNTNAWVLQYIYKRLRFLNNRYISQACALTFLSVWHGIHSGYYACFLMEFIVMFFEKNFNKELNKFPHILSKLEAPPVSYLKFVVLKVYVVIFMGYCLGPFVLLKSYRRGNRRKLLTAISTVLILVHVLRTLFKI